MLVNFTVSDTVSSPHCFSLVSPFPPAPVSLISDFYTARQLSNEHSTATHNLQIHKLAPVLFLSYIFVAVVIVAFRSEWSLGTELAVTDRPDTCTGWLGVKCQVTYCDWSSAFIVNMYFVCADHEA